MVVSRSTDQVGRVLSGRYRLIAPVGTGASAQVFLADDVRLKRRVAVKVLHDALAQDESFLRRFRAEAQAAAALNHPNILAVYDWGDDEGSPYLVTEYLGGGSLRSMLDRGLRCSTAQTLLLGLQAARALDYAHRRGFVHRDIKPANLLFGEDGRLRIADFGLARALAEAAWTEPQGAVLGTARYASPEQAQGETVDGKADVYSLGLVLVESATGQVPFVADTTIATLMARVGRDVEVPAALGPLQGLLGRAGRADPTQRPDAGELGVGLMAVAGDLARPEPFPLVSEDLVPDDVPAHDGDVTLHGFEQRGVEEPTRFVPTGEAGAGASVFDLSADEDTGMVLLDPEDIEGYDGPRRRRRWPWVLLILLVVAGLGVAGAWGLRSLNTPSYAVPTLTNMDLDEARNVILQAHHDWDVTTEDIRQDGTEAGQVLRQRPGPKEQLEKGKRITLFVSQGNTLAPLPTDLAGQPFDAAAAALQAAGGFTVKRVDLQSEEVPKDTVIGYSVVDGQPVASQLPKQSEVSLDVSSGPAPRTVPGDLGDGTYQGAVAALQAVQLKASQVDVFSDTVPAGKVVGTDPGAGAKAPRDSTVKVQVSKGPDLVAVPNVKGKTLAQANDALEAAGLTPGNVFGPSKGTPFTTEPEAGTKVKRGTKVDIYLK